jgi:hypothetical protein
MPKTYSKNIKSTANPGDKGYNPIITEYYDSADNLVRVEHGFSDGTVWAQTISGSFFAENWPTYSGTIVYGAWEVV